MNLLLNETDAQAVLWAIQNTIEDRAGWYEEHWPSEREGDWLQAAMEERLKIERLVTALTERNWPDSRRAEQLAQDAGQLAAEILVKCATDPAGAAERKERVKHGAA
jgi:hypothetical protein